MAASGQSPRFGRLLQRHRLAAGLSQEELAERAGLSRRGISDLERGKRRPLPATARRLADALDLEGQGRADFLNGTDWRVPAAPAEEFPQRHVPIALSSFVGRQDELAQIRALVQTARLVTLTGSGGVGKTRLAMELARAIEAEQERHVCLVELAAITADASAVARATLAALGLAEQTGRAPIEALIFGLRNAHLLLLLDNCEQVLDACAQLADAVLSRCPGVCILATSRERLGISGETVWRVPSMSVPRYQRASAVQLEQCDSTRLFVERARSLMPDFFVSDQNAPALANICAQLDGIPLAIELAAAQVAALTIEQISQRLDDALRLLVRGNRTAPPRQQTLRATITWSYALLDPVEQLLFDRLSVFAGGWTLESAEAICTEQDILDPNACIHRDDVVDLLSRLIAKSLVIASPDRSGAKRYRLLETLRQYARERLTERGETNAINDRHADYFLTWADQAMSASDTSYSLAQVSVELDNLRAALRWLIRTGDADRGLRLAAATRWYWFRHGWLSEGYQWFSQILELTGSHADSEELAHVVSAAALVAGRQATMVEAEQLHVRALALWRRLGNDHEIARSLSQLGYVYRNTGNHDRAYACFDEGRAISCQRNLFQMEAMNSIGLAETLYDQERYDQALIHAQRAFEIHAMDFFAGNPGRSWVRRAIGLIHYQRGERPLARQFLQRAVDVARAVEGVGWWLPDALACAAQLEVDERRLTRARALLEEALNLAVSLGDRRIIVRCLERIAYLATAEGQYRRALWLDSAAENLRRAAGLPRAPVETRMLQTWLAPAASSLEADLGDQVRREGASMTLDEVVAYALGCGG